MSYQTKMELLKIAIMNEDLLKMEEFHERGYSFDTPIRYFHFKSVFHLAALHDKKHVVQFLLKKGSNLKFDSCGNTPAHYSSLPMLKLINIWRPVVNLEDDQGVPLLCHFTSLEYVDHVKWLLENGASVNGASRLDGSCPSHIIMTGDNVACLYHIVKNGADFRLRDSQGKITELA